MSKHRFLIVLAVCLAIFNSLHASINNWEVLRSFGLIIQELRKTHHVTLDTERPICCIPRDTIKSMIDALKDIQTHPIQRILIAAMLSQLPTSPLRHIVNWNEKQFRELQRLFNIQLSAKGELEIRSTILLHEGDEATSMDLFPIEKTSIGERFSSFITYLIASSVPDEIDYLIGLFLKEGFLPDCVAPGVPSIYHFIKSGILDKHIGDQIDAMLGQCRSLPLIQTGVACAHFDPYVLIQESNRVFEMQTESGRDFAFAMRTMTGELDALRAAGLDYGNEYRNPYDVSLRRAIKREFDVGNTLIRNILK